MQPEYFKRGLLACAGAAMLLAPHASRAAPLENPDGNTSAGDLIYGTVIDGFINYGTYDSNGNAAVTIAGGTLVNGDFVNDGTSGHTGLVMVTAGPGFYLNGFNVSNADVYGDIKNLEGTIAIRAGGTTRGAGFSYIPPIEEDPLYNQFGHGASDLWSVQVDGVGNVDFYDENGVFQFSATVAALGGYTGSGTVLTYGSNITDVANGTYWMGTNGALYAMDPSDPKYRLAVNYETFTPPDRTGTGINVDSYARIFGSILNDGTIDVITEHISLPVFPGDAQGAWAISNGINFVQGQLTGSITNSGSIYSTARATVDSSSSTPLDSQGDAYGIRVSGSIGGGIINQGMIMTTASGERTISIGILVDNGAIVPDGITNTGMIVAYTGGTTNRLSAIDITEAGAGMSVRQQDGIIDSDIHMENIYADSFEFSGGLINGNIYGDNNDAFVVYAGVNNALSYSGTIDGFNALYVNTTLRAANPVEFLIGGTVTNTTDLNVNANGTLVLGVPGRINVTNYNQAAGSHVEWVMTPSANGLITAHNVNIDPGASASVLLGFGMNFNGKSFVLIDSATAPDGDFGSLTSDSAFYSVNGLWNGDDDYVVTIKLNHIDFIVSGLTPDGRALADMLQGSYGSIDPSSAFGVALSQLIGEAPKDYAAAINAMAGSQNADMVMAGYMQSDALFKILLHQINGFGGGSFASNTTLMVADNKIAASTINDAGPSYSFGGAKDGQAMSGWVRAFGNWSSLDSSARSSGYTSSGGGVIAGLDYQLSDDLLAGAFGGYQKQNLHFRGTGAGDIKSLDFGAYAKYALGDMHLNALLGYSKQTYALERRFTILGTNYAATRHNDGGTFAAAFEAGYDFKFGKASIVEPFLDLNLSRSKIDGAMETGAGVFNLVLGDEVLKSARTKLGARWSQTFKTEQGLSLTPMLELGWRHEFGDRNAAQTATLVGQPGGAFQVLGTRARRDAATLGASVNFKLNHSLDAGLQYDGEFASGARSSTASVNFVLRF